MSEPTSPESPRKSIETSPREFTPFGAEYVVDPAATSAEPGLPAPLPPTPLPPVAGPSPRDSRAGDAAGTAGGTSGDWGADLELMGKYVIVAVVMLGVLVWRAREMESVRTERQEHQKRTDALLKNLEKSSKDFEDWNAKFKEGQRVAEQQRAREVFQKWMHEKDARQKWTWEADPVQK